MSSMITVNVADLYKLIDVLAVTVAKPNAGDESYPAILFYTQRGSLGSSVGESTFLCGVSSTGVAAGSEYIVASGELDGQYVLTPSSRNELQAMLKSWVKEDSEAEVKIVVGESGSSTVSLVGADDRAVRFYMPDGSNWPVQGVFDMISGESARSKVDVDGVELEAGKRIRLSEKSLKVLHDVAKRRGGAVDLIVPKHPASVILAEREDWVGAVFGEEYATDSDVSGRDVEFLGPESWNHDE